MTEKKAKTVHVLYTFFDQRLSEQAWDRHLRKLPEEIQTRARRYRRWQDRQAAVFGKLLLIEGLREFGCTESAIFRTWSDAHGRPRLECGVDFNISHSGEYVVCAVSNDTKVGIDIEKRKEFPFTEIADCLNAAEKQELIRSENRIEMFFDMWTMKESVLKGDGRGLSIPMEQVVVEDGRARLDGMTWFLKELDFGKDYSCHLAVNVEAFEIETKELEFDKVRES